MSESPPRNFEGARWSAVCLDAACRHARIRHVEPFYDQRAATTLHRKDGQCADCSCSKFRDEIPPAPYTPPARHIHYPVWISQYGRSYCYGCGMYL